ncbi:hypothetical protein NKJ88_05945 [Mesorhizobium sp. M0016]|uniref:hypothetical protein n=1 Tax=Mesorhizobium sp. M0016 TaxID=2956843 RepID=UPI00333B853E
MDNVGPGEVVHWKAMTLDEEHRFRRDLPPKLKEFILYHMSVPPAWNMMRELLDKLGEAGLLDHLKRTNAMIQVREYGRDFHRRLSPYRKMGKLC